MFKVRGGGGEEIPLVQGRTAAALRWSSHEEIPHVQGQGQKPGGTHARSAVTKRSYPTSEVRGGGRTSHPVPEARGDDPEEPS